MKRQAVFLMVVIMLLTGCGRTEGTPDFSQAMPGEKVILSEHVYTEVVPTSAVPYGTKPALAFTDLELSRDGDNLHGKASFARQGQDDFTLVVYLSMPHEVLIGYIDAEKRLILNLPDGTVLLGTQSYNLSGDKTGTIEFSLIAKTFNGYDVSGQQGTAYLFAVPGTVNPRSTLPGDQTDPQTYHANSNVLKADFQF